MSSSAASGLQDAFAHPVVTGADVVRCVEVAGVDLATRLLAYGESCVGYYGRCASVHAASVRSANSSGSSNRGSVVSTAGLTGARLAAISRVDSWRQGGVSGESLSRASVPDGFCYVKLLSRNRVESVVQRHGDWPTLGAVVRMSSADFLPLAELERFRLTGDRADVKHVAAGGCDGMSFLDAVAAYASRVKLQPGTLGSAVAGCRKTVPGFENLGGAVRLGGKKRLPRNAREVAECLPGVSGYCYTGLLNLSVRNSVAGRLGPWPILGDLVNLSYLDFLPLCELDGFELLGSGGGRAHVVSEGSGGVSFLDAVASCTDRAEFLSGSFGRLVADGRLSLRACTSSSKDTKVGGGLEDELSVDCRPMPYSSALSRLYAQDVVNERGDSISFGAFVSLPRNRFLSLTELQSFRLVGDKGDGGRVSLVRGGSHGAPFLDAVAVFAYQHRLPRRTFARAVMDTMGGSFSGVDVSSGAVMAPLCDHRKCEVLADQLFGECPDGKVWKFVQHLAAGTDAYRLGFDVWGVGFSVYVHVYAGSRYAFAGISLDGSSLLWPMRAPVILQGSAARMLEGAPRLVGAT